MKVGKGLKFNKKKKELWLDPKTFPPVPVGQLGGAVIGGGGSNTGVKRGGEVIVDTARFINFTTDFLIQKDGNESVSIDIKGGAQLTKHSAIPNFGTAVPADQATSDALSPSIVLTSGGNNKIYQNLNMNDFEIENAKLDGGTFS